MKHGKFSQNVICIDFVHCNIARAERKYNAVGTADILATCHLASFFLTNRDQFKVSMLKNLSNQDLLRRMSIQSPAKCEIRAGTLVLQEKFQFNEVKTTNQLVQFIVQMYSNGAAVQKRPYFHAWRSENRNFFNDVSPELRMFFVSIAD